MRMMLFLPFRHFVVCAASSSSWILTIALRNFPQVPRSLRRTCMYAVYLWYGWRREATNGFRRECSKHRFEFLVFPFCPPRGIIPTVSGPVNNSPAPLERTP
ncbi:hypothetical protein B0H63DRAFT_487605 [Podospora didyma]|uniref:Uncharacterized protein n=1 Tax=Podospora didyma TaxID=330526 RepID=A0AAE0K142_9PEZI|nr:hypothetical protein B0H63DRAFT_487605 [Podospora didyma]